MTKEMIMLTSDNLSEILTGAKLSDFTIVEEINFIRKTSLDFAYPFFETTLILLSEKPYEKKLHINFSKVTNFSLGPSGSGLVQIMGLYLKNVSNQGWENIKWEVGDYENQASIHLYAKEIYMNWIAISKIHYSS
jgi:hypothetical protein